MASKSAFRAEFSVEVLSVEAAHAAEDERIPSSSVTTAAVITAAAAAADCFHQSRRVAVLVVAILHWSTRSLLDKALSSSRSKDV